MLLIQYTFKIELGSLHTTIYRYSRPWKVGQIVKRTKLSNGGKTKKIVYGRIYNFTANDKALPCVEWVDGTYGVMSWFSVNSVDVA